MTGAEYLVFVGREEDRGEVESLVRAALSEVHGGQAPAMRIVTVEADPDVAATHRVIATPMIIRQVPLPVRRLVGLPRSPAALADALGLALPEEQPTSPRSSAGDSP